MRAVREDGKGEGGENEERDEPRVLATGQERHGIPFCSVCEGEKARGVCGPEYGMVHFIQKIARLCSQERTVYRFVLSRTPVCSPPTLECSQGQGVWSQFAIS